MDNKYSSIETKEEGKIFKINLNRPEIHNALNNILINELYDVFENLKTNNSIRVIILSGNGKSFCAGAYLNWLKSVKDYSFEQNLEESLKLAKLMFMIHNYPKPVIAKVNGSAIGGGVGLMSVCDIIIANQDAVFSLSEVKLGLVPAVIAPFVISKIGETVAREYFITGERISAQKAFEVGLINAYVPFEKLDEYINEKINFIIQNGPEAMKAVKELIFNVSQLKFPELQEYTAKLIANLRISDEGQEGMNAFLEKRKPNFSI